MPAPPPTLDEAKAFFAWLDRDPAPTGDYLGVRTVRPPNGPFRLTIVPFAGDRELAALAADAQVEAWPLLVQVFTGDPDEDLETAVEGIANAYENVIVTTHHPRCEITDHIAERAPRLQALLDYVERRYVPYDQLPAG